MALGGLGGIGASISRAMSGMGNAVAHAGTMPMGGRPAPLSAGQFSGAPASANNASPQPKVAGTPPGFAGGGVGTGAIPNFVPPGAAAAKQPGAALHPSWTQPLHPLPAGNPGPTGPLSSVGSAVFSA